MDRKRETRRGVRRRKRAHFSPSSTVQYTPRTGHPIVPKEPQQPRRGIARETPTVNINEAFDAPENPFTPSLQSIRLPAPALDLQSSPPSLATKSGSAILRNPNSQRRSHIGTATSYDATIQSPSFPLTDWSVESPEQNFFSWLNEELKKVQTFYIEKEKEAAVRFRNIRSQLHEMRELYHDQREQKKKRKRASLQQDVRQETGRDYTRRNPTDSNVKVDTPESDPSKRKWLGHNRPGKAIFNAGHQATNWLGGSSNDPSYVAVRHKLKVACLELYRGMEMLKSYRMLNRTAFTKILKKFDKTANAHVSKSYMDEKVEPSYVFSSDVLEALMSDVEDVVARYFERGNRKHAIEILRTKEKTQPYNLSVLYSGLLLGCSLPLIVQGIVLARDPSTALIVPQKDSLLQIWAGFSLIGIFLLLFGINCWAWSRAKINYVFIFEFDTRHNLDYREYFEIPSLLTFMGSVFFLLSFQNNWPDRLPAIYYPLFFVCLCLFIFAFPIRIMHRSSRYWFAIANFRILLSGLYPVEFRDFFLGDQYNSLSYCFGNVAVFLCLYSNQWTNPPACSSSRSRAIGFMTTLPGIWRLLQCLRRYRDTHNVFPHLVNGGKYTCTILFYLFLSLWRINSTDSNALFALFVTMGVLNSLYTCKSLDYYFAS